MKLARCIDSQGRTLWVEPLDQTRGLALEGTDLFSGLRPGDEEVEVEQWLAPLEPAAIYGVGLNYRAHAAETGAQLPDSPVLFMKPGTAVTDPGSPILRTRAGGRLRGGTRRYHRQNRAQRCRERRARPRVRLHLCE